jgi:hypothetical protein
MGDARQPEGQGAGVEPGDQPPGRRAHQAAQSPQPRLRHLHLRFDRYIERCRNA